MEERLKQIASDGITTVPFTIEETSEGFFGEEGRNLDPDKEMRELFWQMIRSRNNEEGCPP